MDAPEQLAAYERQFRRAGLPMFVEGFSASTDVFTRAAPLLGLVFVGELLGAGQLDWTLVAEPARHRRRGGVPASARHRRASTCSRAARRARSRSASARPSWRRSSSCRRSLPLIFGGQVGSAATTIGANLLLLALIYAVFVYGLLAILRWVARPARGPAALLARAARQRRPAAGDLRPAVVRQPGDVADLRDLSAFAYFARSASSSLLGSAFLGARVPRETRRLEREASADGPPLSRSQRINVGLVLFVSQAVQVLFVSVFIGGFFVLFGMLAIDDRTARVVARTGPATTLGHRPLRRRPVRAHRGAAAGRRRARRLLAASTSRSRC